MIDISRYHTASKVAAAVITALVVFVAPWFVPPNEVVVGPSYTLGFNNKIAVLGVLVSIGHFTSIGAIGSRDRDDGQLFDLGVTRPRIPGPIVWAVGLIPIVFAGHMYFSQETGFFGDSHFIVEAAGLPR